MQASNSIIVIGAGLVGAVQALLFAQAGFSVTVVEKNRLRDDLMHSDAISSRTVALSYRSWQLLTDAGLWPSVDCCPIRTVHVSEQGNFGSVRLDADKLDVEALGYVVSNSGFESDLHSRLKNHVNIQIIESAVVVAVGNDQQTARVTVEQSGVPRELCASLVVAADGTQSAVRGFLGIESSCRDYQQSAVLANVETSRSLEACAFERFTRDGPLALLPLTSEFGQRYFYSLIYTVPTVQAAQISGLTDSEFLALVQKKFGGRLGRFESIGKRYIAELALTVSMQQVRGRFVLMGNAMRTLHPVAGQGMNLALRDVFGLVSSLTTAEGMEAGLKHFVQQRRRDQWWVTKQTDVLARMFAGKPGVLDFPASLLTGSGFVLLDIIEPFKRAFATANMGRYVPLSKVAR